MATRSISLINGKYVSSNFTAPGIGKDDTFNISAQFTKLNESKIMVVSVVPTPFVYSAYPALFTLTAGNGQYATSSGQSSGICMTYLKTIASSSYTLKVTQCTSYNSYILKIAVVDAIEPFKKCDAMIQLYKGKNTYMISNDPETPTSSYTAENNYYLCRGHLSTYAEVYYEHINQFTSPMKFGILLWNRESYPIKVTVRNRSSGSASLTSTDTEALKAALLGVWTDVFNGVKESDDSQIPVTQAKPNDYYEIPAYSTCWVAVKTFPAKKLFNGALNLHLTYKKDGTDCDYDGDLLYCDTYIMQASTSITTIASRVSSMNLAPTGGNDKIRGSGNAAVLYYTRSSAVNNATVTNPHKILITGDVPAIQEGEEISLKAYKKTGGYEELPNGKNYAVQYRFNFAGGFTGSSGTVKIRFKCNPQTNPAAAMKDFSDPNVEKYPGIYVAGFFGLGTGKFSKLILTNTTDADATIDTGIAAGNPVTFTVVVSGMSSLPLEIDFYTS